MASEAVPAGTMLAPLPIARSPWLRLSDWSVSSASMPLAWDTATAFRLGVLLLVTLGVTIAVFTAPVNWTLLGHYGYIGVFVITLLASGSVILPVPYLGAIVVAG